MNPIPRPLFESYWFEPGRFLAGEYPARQSTWDSQGNLRALLNAGFDAFIDLTSPEEFTSYENDLVKEAARLGLIASYQRFPIEDFGLPSREQMTSILDAIDNTLSSGHRLYLHCWGGVGRTGTTVGCYLVRHGMSGEAALCQLADWWQEVPKSRVHPRSPETEAQREFIRSWHELA
jgi:Swiss Army Knife protein, DSP-PTPase phosphatase domain